MHRWFVIDVSTFARHDEFTVVAADMPLYEPLTINATLLRSNTLTSSPTGVSSSSQGTTDEDFSVNTAATKETRAMFLDGVRSLAASFMPGMVSFAPAQTAVRTTEKTMAHTRFALLESPNKRSGTAADQDGGQDEGPASSGRAAAMGDPLFDPLSSCHLSR